MQHHIPADYAERVTAALHNPRAAMYQPRVAESLPPMCKEHPYIAALIIDDIDGTPLCGACAMTRQLEAQA